VIVEAGLSKYSRGELPIKRPSGSRRLLLVPGQVEDDRSVQLGGCGLTANLDLLMRVRQEAPEAHILYKPHPDVLAGHRQGAIPDEKCLRYADEVVGAGSISALIRMVDEVHVNTSLAGFEALMRGKPVTTYGVPFYAGWSLTRDLGPVPARRSAVRTLDELVAAALLSYPRYLDPATGLPCPPEVVVARLIAGNVPETNLLVAARRIQGRVLRSVRSLVK
jgi:capsular polysaccharide export protein